MRSLESAGNSWSAFENVKTLAQLRDNIQHNDPSDSLAESLRSVCWKAFLIFDNVETSAWAKQLEHSRDQYTALRTRFLRNIQNPNETDSFSDPLSEDSKSPWNSLRVDETSRQEIFQDVERCMPENLYFRQPSTQNMLLDILFIWSKTNPDIGYRQGMHEVAATVLWVVERDAVDRSTTSTSTARWRDVISNVLDSEFIGHDTFTLFMALMQELKLYFDTNERTRSMEDVPVITHCKRITEEYLVTLDPPLANHFRSVEIVPQIYLLRWIRLLFGREFPFDQVLALWDCLFAEGLSLQHVDLICVAMILRIRWQLIDADYNTALTLLLHYPDNEAVQRPSDLVDDALYLKENMNFDGGSKVIERTTGQAPSVTNRPRTPDSSAKTEANQSSPGNSTHGFPVSHSRHSSGIDTLLQDAARGVFRRGESWSLNKAVQSAVGEVRNTVQELQSKRGGSRQGAFHHRTGSAFSEISEDPTAELVKQVEALENRNKALARMLESAVEDLWQQQKDAASKSSPDDDQLRAFTTAIAKVQLTQVFLADTTIPLPAEEEESPDTAQEAQQHQPAKNVKTDTTSQGPIAMHPAPKKPSTAPRNVTRDKATAAETSQATGTSRSATPEAKSRPSLEHSPFSWMLGQGDKAQPTMGGHKFLARAASSRRSEMSTGRNVDFLFGEAIDDEDFIRGSSAGIKGRDGDKNVEEEDREDIFKLGTMKGRPKDGFT